MSCMCRNLKPFSFQVSIPLLNIKNEEKKWFKLKGKSLSKLAKGDCPEILLEIKLFWNQFSYKFWTKFKLFIQFLNFFRFRAAKVLFSKYEEKYSIKQESSFKTAIMTRNRNRLQRLIQKLDREAKQKFIRYMV